MSTFNIWNNRFVKSAIQRNQQNQLNIKNTQHQIVNISTSQWDINDDVGSPISLELNIPIFNETRLIKSIRTKIQKESPTSYHSN